jgi:chromosome segregation protein
VSRLRELRLHGFKTFAEPTRFVFEPGVNAVIGPNGSGKSNMADAVRWVLGEQSNRSLRTRRADDVIFAGSQQRKPTGLAEVVMTLDNADGWLPIDFAEVTVGRRAYRSGEAEYLINGARVRLRDITELLSAGQLGASSLVIVGQGTVDAALSLRPEERRQLFEEAAGVKNLQVRKNEALGRLGRAEENLTRVNDLVSELKPQVRRLALQAEHQQEHDTLGHRARALVQESHRRRERALREELGDARRREAAALSAAETLRSEIAAGRDAIAGAETRYWEAEKAARDAAQASEAAREALIRLESRAEALGARVAASQKRLDAARSELESLAGEEPSDGGAAAGLGEHGADAALDEAFEAAASAERGWQAAVEALAAADRELLAAEEALAGARARDAEALVQEARLRDAAAERAAKAERLEQEIADIGRAQTEAESAVAYARSEAERSRAEAETASAGLAEATAASEVSRRRADEARVQATATAERLAAAQAELDALDERTDRSGGIGERLTASGWRSLVDAVRAPEGAWPAVESVIGGELTEAFIWKDADPGSATADASGTVRLLDGRRPPEPAERQRALLAVGARRTLAEWIGGSETPGIFARVAVAPDLGSLLAGWRNLPAGWSAVTAEGDLADGRGLVALRGRADPPGGAAARQMLRRRQVAEELATLEPAYGEAADAAASAVAEAAASERLRAKAQEISEAAEIEARRLAADAIEAERGLERILAESGRLREERAELGSVNASSPVATKPNAPERMERASGEARAARAREQRDAAAASRETARAAWLQARQHADELERSAIGSRRRVAELAVRRESLERAIGEAQTDLDALARERQELDKELAVARAAEQEAAVGRGEADGQRERLRAELLGLERQESGASGQLTDLDRAHQAAALEVARHDDALVALAREREIALEGLSPETAADDEPGVAERTGSAEDPGLAAEIAELGAQELEAELRRIRRLLGQIGSVNPFAVEEHREHAARLQSLSTQEADLRSAIAATRELISQLDAEINERFAVAFRAIGAAFDEFVQLLFAGGSASLEQVDGEEDGTGGIEIVVRPPGKRPQRLAMLSGGERALTGVALLFAMLSVNPVPFCILDEVDAALDEANIGRFAAALRKLADTIDFVVITHNRATIEVADTIYGVTMTDAAVSRVVSLRLADLPVEAIV